MYFDCFVKILVWRTFLLRNPAIRTVRRLHFEQRYIIMNKLRTNTYYTGACTYCNYFIHLLNCNACACIILYTLRRALVIAVSCVKVSYKNADRPFCEKFARKFVMNIPTNITRCRELKLKSKTLLSNFSFFHLTEPLFREVQYYFN